MAAKELNNNKTLVTERGKIRNAKMRKCTKKPIAPPTTTKTKTG